MRPRNANEYRPRNTRPMELATPACEKGIGKVILAPDSKDLIAGVRIHPYPVWPDDRGYFLEVARMGQGLAADFPRKPRRFRPRSAIPAPSRLFTSIATRPIAGCRWRACCKWRWWICATNRPPSASATRCMSERCGAGNC